MSRYVELSWVKLPIPQSAKADLENLCERMRAERGLHYGQTSACLLLIGLNAVRRSDSISPSILSAVRGF